MGIIAYAVSNRWSYLIFKERYFLNGFSFFNQKHQTKAGKQLHSFGVFGFVS